MQHRCQASQRSTTLGQSPRLSVQHSIASDRSLSRRTGLGGRHYPTPNCILGACKASGTRSSPRLLRSRRRRRPALPNSGRCESAYLFVDLYVVNGGGDRQLSRAIRIEGRAKHRLFTVCGAASGIVWSRADQPALAGSAGAVVAGLPGGCFPGWRTRICCGDGSWPWRAAGRRGERAALCGKGDRAWCVVLVAREGGGVTAPGRVAWAGLRGRALGCRRRLGTRGGLVPAGGPGPVEQHRDGGGHDRGT
jgi:hypothetical protein